MNERGDGSLDERVERLEKETEEIQGELRYALGRMNRLLAERDPAPDTADLFDIGTPPLAAQRVPDKHSDAPSRAVSEDATSREGRRLPFDLGGLRSGEWWLNKIGIGLLLFGIAFLFLLAVERGWIGPRVRVGFGLAVGAALIALGLLLHERRRAFSQVLLGGGVAALYMSAFAAFQLYHLVSYPVALVFMVAVTLLAFFLALRQDGVTLSLIGVLGGLGTPFLLYTDSGALGGLVIYTCLILAGAVAVYLYKGWSSLFIVSFVGGWMVFLIGFATNFPFYTDLPVDEQRALQAGVAFAWLLYALAPVAGGFRSDARVPHGLVPGLVGSTPLIALGFTEVIWELPAKNLGWITLSGAVVYALGAFALRRFDARFAYTHALVALLLLTLTFVLVFDGNALLFALAAEAAALHFIARRLSDRIISVEAHLLSFVAAAWLAGRLLDGVMDSFVVEPGTDIFDIRNAVDLAVIALAFAASVVALPRRLDLVYRISAHVALLLLLWRELSTLPGSAGDAYVTVAWGLYAVGLLIGGLRLDRASLVRGGMAVLFVVVGKLFLVDLAEVEAVWRVILFIGFGGLFLALSYYLQVLWRPGSGEDPNHPSGTAGGTQ